MIFIFQKRAFPAFGYEKICGKKLKKQLDKKGFTVYNEPRR